MSKGYLVPETPQPPDMVCVKIYVPNHQLYIAAFWGAYYFFTQWTAWQRDPLKKGRLAAQAWRAAFNKARDDFEKRKGACEMAITDIRIDPLNPCNVQVKEDGGEWTDKLSIGDCGGSCGCDGGGAPRRYNGSTMQHYDPCTKTWVDDGPPSNPGTDIIPIGKYPENDCGYGLAGANLARMIEDGKNKMADRIGDGATFGTMVLEIFEGLTVAIPGLLVFAAAIEFLQLAYLYLSVNYAGVAAFDLYVALSPILPGFFERDGSITQANFNAMLARVDAIGNAQADPSPERTAYSYAYSWIKAAGPAGVVQISDAGGVTEFDCETAEWEEVFDYTLSSGGFSPWLRAGTLYARYDAGIGWHSRYEVSPAGLDEQMAIILRGTQEYNLTYIKLTYDILEGVNEEPLVVPSVVVTSGVFGVSGDELIAEQVETGDNQSIEWTGDETATGISVQLFAGVGHIGGGTDPGGYGIVKRLILRGTGDNPFRV